MPATSARQPHAACTRRSDCAGGVAWRLGGGRGGRRGRGEGRRAAAACCSRPPQPTPALDGAGGDWGSARVLRRWRNASSGHARVGGTEDGGRARGEARGRERAGGTAGGSGGNGVEVVGRGRRGEDARSVREARSTTHTALARWMRQHAHDTSGHVSSRRRRSTRTGRASALRTPQHAHYAISCSLRCPRIVTRKSLPGV